MPTGRISAESIGRIELKPDAAVAIVDGCTIALGPEPWLRLDVDGGITRNRWVRIRYAASYFDDPVRPLIRFVTSDGHEYIQVMNGPVAGCGEWIGRVPKRTRRAFVSPASARGQFSFRLEKIEPIPRGFLLKRGIKYDKRSLMQALGAKVINAEEEHWDTLKFAASATPLQKYDSWYRRNYRPLDLSGLDRPRSDWARAPSVRLLLALRGTSVQIERTIASLRAQAFSNWTLTAVVSDESPDDLRDFLRREIASDKRVSLSAHAASYEQVAKVWHERDLVGLIDAGDFLPDHALAVVIESISQRPQVRLIYGDEDASSEAGTLHSPIFKPDWSPGMYRESPYLGRLTLMRNGDLAELRPRQTQDLFVNEASIQERLIGHLEQSAIHHVRRVIYRRFRSLKDDAVGVKRIVSPPSGSARSEPKVSIIIPTRDRPELLDQCLTSIYRHTRYKAFEIVIVDNGTKNADAKALLRRCRDRPDHVVIERPGPFNYSSLCNDGAAAAANDLLVFLNNDIVVYEENWLRNLAVWASKPDVGAAGAKLLFPDRSIEHAGVVIGHGGLAGHVHHRESASSPGYMGQLILTREVSAATGACLAIERRKFDKVGGFDSENLPIDLNDIDLCLKLRECGWRIIWTPDSVMYHLQSASRGFPVRPSRTYRKERAYFRKRWMQVIRDDPYFHPALSLYSHKLALA